MTVPDTAMRLVVDREIVGEDLGMHFNNGQRDYFAKKALPMTSCWN